MKPKGKPINGKGNKGIIIIGAGISGLAAAALLAQSGFEVTVLEKHSAPGGVAGQIHQDGFTFDMGPTWYLMPEIFDHYFDLLGEKVEDHLSLTKLDPSYKIFIGDSQSFLISPALEQNLKLFDRIEQDSGKRLKSYLADAEFKYRTAVDSFLYKDYRTIFDFFNKKILLEGGKLQLFRSLDKHASVFFRQKILRQILEYNTVFLGSSPYNTPALYSLMSHVDINLGVYYPKGGIYSLIQALYRLARAQGVRFAFNTEAEQILSPNGKASAVLTSNKESIPADIVLSTIDYRYSEEKLLSPKQRSYSPRYWRRRTLAPGAFLVYAGLNKKLPHLEHHSLFIDPDWEKHFDSIFQIPRWPRKFSYYIGLPSKTDPGMAPEGGESLFMLLPVAPGLEDTPAVREEMSARLFQHLEGITGERISPHIVSQQIRSINNFRDEHNLFRGTALGLAHTLFQSAVFRPKRKSKKIDNLYYTGHYTHPGIGMPMVLISAEVTAKRIIEETT
jgi:phytoene desaturase